MEEIIDQVDINLRQVIRLVHEVEPPAQCKP